jgi:iron complex transport system permease protein
VKIKIVLFLSSGLLTAVVVSFAGTIGFIGLVVPHFGRMLSGSDNTRLVWIVPFLGATLCILADLLARTVLSPGELPVGVITAFLGVPVFLYFMARSRLHAAG